nr:carbohydrate kinase [Chitinophagaceae bacterium]
MVVDLDALFNDISKLKVAVIGDVMLDTYWWGTVDRISPEGPVPVVAVTKKEHRIGGAGN